MTIGHILEELPRLSILHPLTPTNVDAVRINQGGVEFQADNSALNSELAHARSDFQRAKRELDELGAENNKLRVRAERAEALLDEINGSLTLRKAIEDMEEAKEAMRKWATHAAQCEEEVKALRKKKGINANYFRLQREVLCVIRSLDLHPEGKHDVSDLVKKLW